jgi:hypothetical protein
MVGIGTTAGVNPVSELGFGHSQGRGEHVEVLLQAKEILMRGT